MSLRAGLAAAFFVCAAAAQDWLDLAPPEGLTPLPLFEQPDADPSSNDDSKTADSGRDHCPGGSGRPGVVTHLWITVSGRTKYGLGRGCSAFRVYYDGSPEPSVDAPLGDFFGVGHGWRSRSIR